MAVGFLHDRSLLRRTLLAAFMVTCLAAFAQAAAGAAERPLSELVPADAALYVEMRGLKEHVEAFRASPQFARLTEFLPWQKWRKREGRGLAHVVEKFGKYFGVDATELWEKIVGHEVAIAVWPAAEGHPGRAPAVLLVRSSDAETLQRAAAGFRDSQERLESTRWQSASHQGVEYHVGVREAKKRNLFVAVLGDIGLLSESEPQLQAVLALHASGEASRSLARLPAYQAAKKSAPASAAITVFVNPRPWDDLIQADVATAPEAQRDEKQMTLDTWRAVHFGAASLELAPRLRLQAMVKYETGKLPQPVREFVAALGGRGDFLEKTPADCLLAFAGRLNVDRLVRLAQAHGELASGEGKAGGLLWRALRMLGPDAGIYFTAREAGGVKEGLLDAAAVLHVRPQLQEMLPNAEELLKTTLPKLAAKVLRAWHDSALTDLAELLLGNGLRLVEDGASPAAELPLFFKEGRLWLATSDPVLRKAAALPAENSLARGSHWKNLLTDAVEGPSYALYVDCLAWRRLLSKHRKELVDGLARQRKIDAELADRGFGQFLSVLNLADRLGAAVKISDGTLAVSLSVAVDAPKENGTGP